MNHDIIARMKKKDRLPDGWAWPLKSSEISIWFQEIDLVYWQPVRRPKQWPTLGSSIVTVNWLSRDRAYRLGVHIRAVESDLRASIHDWLIELVLPEARKWLDELPRRPETWRDQAHTIAWKWVGDSKIFETVESASAY
jgi:hypothetical protein